MYIEEGVTINKASDGTYLLSVRVKKKKKEDKSSKELATTESYSEPKVITAKNVDEVTEHLKKILPEMKNSVIDEDDFDKAFEAAAKED